MSNDARELDGLVAIVTGGASGIGLATAKLLRDRGATVAVFDRTATDERGLESYPCDITDDANVREAVAAVAKAHGRIDILINNAGIGATGTVEENEIAEWQRVFDVNVFGIVRVSSAAMPLLRESPAASIVNTASIASNVGLVNRALYSASKGAVTALTRAMAVDGIPLGVRVNAVTPGTAATPWVDRLLAAADNAADAKAALEARQPIGRLITPEEIAYGIAYLASPLAGSTTGTVLPIDGGLHSLR